MCRKIRCDEDFWNFFESWVNLGFVQFPKKIGFGYRNNFVFIWQILSNHELTKA